MAVERLATSLYNARNGNITSEENRKKVGEAAVGTSAAAAAGRKAGFSMFKSSQKAYNLSGEVIDNIKLANKPIKETIIESNTKFSRWFDSVISITQNQSVIFVWHQGCY